MLFNSFSFAIFLPIVFTIYWLVPHKYRWGIILIASYYFYMSWNVKYVFLILFTTFVSYIAARMIEKANQKKYRKLILASTCVICLGVLVFFKYFNFISESVADFFAMFSIHFSPMTLKLMIPVGISFYTFQTLSYVIDVYKGTCQAERHFGIYAAFVSFFPQLVAGPIERTRNLLPQIKEKHIFSYQQGTYGLKLMAWGFFKKIVIADGLAVYVSKVFECPQNFTGFALILAVFFFTIQIYCDFSGYSDIAIGTAKLLGIELICNFKSPYFSTSIKEFWNRWHISLSTWFRDYVYIPLGGNRVGKLRHYYNILVTFLASGLWHGANWTYIIWGGLHGVAQVVENLCFSKNREKRGIKRIISILCVFAFCTVAWCFFAANSLGDIIYIFKNAFNGCSSPIQYFYQGFATIGLEKEHLAFYIVMIIILALYDHVSLKNDVIDIVSNYKKGIRWVFYCTIVVLVVLGLPISKSTEFIYFQF